MFVSLFFFCMNSASVRIQLIHFNHHECILWERQKLNSDTDRNSFTENSD